MDSHTHCEYTECIFGMKMCISWGVGLFKIGGIDEQTIKSLEKINIRFIFISIIF